MKITKVLIYVLEKFATTIFITTHPGNVGTMLQPFKTMLK